MNRPVPPALPIFVLLFVAATLVVPAASVWAGAPAAVAQAAKPGGESRKPTAPAEPQKQKPKSPATPAPPPVVSGPFTFDKVEAMARELASKPYQAAVAALPKPLADASYDDYRKLRFRPDHALWRGKSRFEVQLFHMGFLFKTPVKIVVVDQGKAEPLTYDKAMFDFGDTDLAKSISAPLDYAGFRVHYDLNDPAYKDEIIVFLGASYFRFLGREQRYGLSARGLAIDTAEPRGEEFPFFRQFWLLTPDPKSTELVIYALMDSQRVTGAYKFVLHPGTDTRIDVTTRLHFRAEVNKVGIAPLTSMHLYGENRSRMFDDHRPEVHDSDGVLIHSGTGAWLWRPLTNGRELRVSAFQERGPRGFGLFQRDRKFAHYQDTEAEYHRRPSYWVEPIGDWGEGAVELVEIPSNEEIHDNIVLYWMPKDRPRAGSELGFSYTLHTMLGDPGPDRIGRVVETRIGSSVVPGTGEKPSPSKRLVVIEFDAGELPLLGAKLPVKPEIRTSNGVVSEPHVWKLPEGGRWRLSFRIDTQGAPATELMAKLVLDGRPITETWMYRYTP